jgi:hypothetical protein
VQRKNPEVFSIFFVVIVALAFLWVAQPPCLGSTLLAGATKTIEPGSTHRKTSPPKKVAASPFDRIFAPGLEKHLARTQTAQSADKRTLKNSSAPAVNTMPNFGGFLSAPLFSAQGASGAKVRTTNHAHESDQSGLRSWSLMRHSRMTCPE